jgi:hypothetical protein
MLVTGVKNFVGPRKEGYVSYDSFEEWQTLARMKSHGETFLVTKSDWVEKILPKLGASKSILVELPSIEPIPPALSEAFTLSSEAWRHYRSGDYDEVLTNCRKTLDSIEQSLESGYVKETESKPDWVKLLQGSLGEELEKIEKGLRGFVQPGPHIGRPVSRSEANFAVVSTHIFLWYVLKKIKPKKE